MGGDKLWSLEQVFLQCHTCRAAGALAGDHEAFGFDSLAIGRQQRPRAS